MLLLTCGLFCQVINAQNLSPYSFSLLEDGKIFLRSDSDANSAKVLLLENLPVQGISYRIKGEELESIVGKELRLTYGSDRRISFRDSIQLSKFNLREWVGNHRNLARERGEVEDQKIVFELILTFMNVSSSRLNISCSLEPLNPVEFDEKRSRVISSKKISERRSNSRMERQSPVARERKSKGEEPVNNEIAQVEVYFATDRIDTKNTNPYKRWGNENDILSYGKCVVSIPPNHELGEIEGPILRVRWLEDPAEHIVLNEIRVLQRASYFDELSRRVQDSKEKSAFLFVHGYNVSFSDAAMRTAQMAYDLSFDGAPVFYSWPSHGSLFKYRNDEKNIEIAQIRMKNFLLDFIKNSQAENIYLIAHSMGNRGLTHAIAELAKEDDYIKRKIKEIILAAPDVNAKTFKEHIAPQMLKVHSPLTLYVSDKDLALYASEEVNDVHRLGDSSTRRLIMDQIETIDASKVKVSLLGHSYFAESTPVISDIRELIQGKKRAKDRKNLETAESPEGLYYLVKQEP